MPTRSQCPRRWRCDRLQRLRAFKAMVLAGSDGLTPGMIAAQLGCTPSALSFHLKELTHAGLVSSEQRGRNWVYRANFEQVRDLLAHLSEHCCAGDECALTPASACPPRRPAAYWPRRCSTTSAAAGSRASPLAAARAPTSSRIRWAWRPCGRRALAPTACAARAGTRLPARPARSGRASPPRRIGATPTLRQSAATRRSSAKPSASRCWRCTGVWSFW